MGSAYFDRLFRSLSTQAASPAAPLTDQRPCRSGEERPALRRLRRLPAQNVDRHALLPRRV
ncbi:MAG TPA: hypothetical protein VMD79_08780 [Solirubrobacteraceae bacterium]|nr:hypothetical protein [Solirubrobacteraceae bacterium]